MSRVIEFHYYCDNYKAAKHPQRTPGDTVMLWAPAKEAVVEVEVCEDCQSTLTIPEAAALADAFGRPPTPAEEDPDLVCPLGCNNSRPFKDKGGRTRHMTRMHPEWEASA